MNVLLLLLALLLASCSTTQDMRPITEAEAHAAVVEVVSLASQSLDTAALAALPLSRLLDEASAHLAQRTEIPLLDLRLNAWADEVREAFRTTARSLADEVEGFAPSLTITDAPSVVRTPQASATSLLMEQFSAQIHKRGAALLSVALAPSQESWTLIRARYEVWQRGRLLLGDEASLPITADLFDHLLSLLIDTFFDALSREELLLRTTPVVKGSGSFLEVFQ